jgi:signal peptidase I
MHNRSITLALVFLGLGFAADCGQRFHAYRIPATSMEPTILRNERVQVDEEAFKSTGPKRGDIVAYHLPTNPATMLVKRVIGLPGETVEIRHKSVIINGAILAEGYAVHTDPKDYSGTDKGEPYKSRDSFGPSELAPTEYFVLGDNREMSMDSRYHGPVDLTLLQGKVIKVAGEGGIREVK